MAQKYMRKPSGSSKVPMSYKDVQNSRFNTVRDHFWAEKTTRDNVQRCKDRQQICSLEGNHKLILNDLARENEMMRRRQMKLEARRRSCSTENLPDLQHILKCVKYDMSGDNVESADKRKSIDSNTTTKTRRRSSDKRTSIIKRMQKANLYDFPTLLLHGDTLNTDQVPPTNRWQEFSSPYFINRKFFPSLRSGMSIPDFSSKPDNKEQPQSELKDALLATRPLYQHQSFPFPKITQPEVAKGGRRKSVQIRSQSLDPNTLQNQQDAFGATEPGDAIALYDLLTRGPGLSHRDACVIQEYLTQNAENENEAETMNQLKRIINGWRITENKLRRSGGNPFDEMSLANYWEDAKQWHFMVKLLYRLRNRGITPFEILHCRYLRLSPTNIQYLEKLCRDAGVDPGIHISSKPEVYDPYLNNLFLKSIFEEHLHQKTSLDQLFMPITTWSGHSESSDEPNDSQHSAKSDS